MPNLAGRVQQGRVRVQPGVPRRVLRDPTRLFRHPRRRRQLLPRWRALPERHLLRAGVHFLSSQSALDPPYQPSRTFKTLSCVQPLHAESPLMLSREQTFLVPCRTLRLPYHNTVQHARVMIVSCSCMAACRVRHWTGTRSAARAAGLMHAAPATGRRCWRTPPVPAAPAVCSTPAGCAAAAALRCASASARRSAGARCFALPRHAWLQPS